MCMSFHFITTWGNASFHVCIVYLTIITKMFISQRKYKDGKSALKMFENGISVDLCLGILVGKRRVKTKPFSFCVTFEI